MKISIIGTSGRAPKAEVIHSKLISSLFDKMVNAVYSLIIEKDYAKDMAFLISGGAAWADHIAVMLFLDHDDKFPNLKLYIPCSFDIEGGKFQDTGVVDWRVNPGGTLNYYHGIFSKVLGRNTLLDIKRAIEQGAVIDFAKKSFHSRNSAVAKSDVIIALTWGTLEPVDGGTLDTWNKVPANNIKHHICLNNI